MFYSKFLRKISLFLSLMTPLHHLERLKIVKKLPELKLIENEFETVCLNLEINGSSLHFTAASLGFSIYGFHIGNESIFPFNLCRNGFQTKDIDAISENLWVQPVLTQPLDKSMNSLFDLLK